MQFTNAHILIAILGITTFLGCSPDDSSSGLIASVISLHVAATDYVQVGNELISLNDLEAELRESVKQADTFVVLDIAPEASMSVVHNVTRSVRDAGVHGVSFASSDRQEFHRPTIRGQ